jgi:uncharacterized protein (TIGR02145 family)
MSSYKKIYLIHRKFFSVNLIVSFIVVLLFSCERFDYVKVVKLETGVVTDTFSTSVIINGRILDAGEDEILQYGHCWSFNKNPTIVDSLNNLGKRIDRGSFLDSISGLSPKTTYFVRAYARNSFDTYYGDEITITTKDGLPILTTAAATNITNTTAISGGSITDDKGFTITARGVCWNTNQNPTITDTMTNDGAGKDSFVSSLTNLSPNTIYYIRAYAINSSGTGYGNQISFKTLGPPIAAFEASPITIFKGEKVQFTDLSANFPTTWNWNFGDGTTSTLQNPQHLYSLAGDYTVSLGVSNNYGTDEEIKNNYITVSDTIGSFTDGRDEHLYKWVKIGSQVWMTENLAYLPAVSPPSLGSETSQYFYVYEYNGTIVNDAKLTSNYITYGVLYNWPAAMNGASSSDLNPSGVQGICPSGWHLPSDAEWKQLEIYLGMSQAGADSDTWRGTTEGGKLKETGYDHWISPNTGATNSSCFTALPGGGRGNNGNWLGVGYYGVWESATEYGTTREWYRTLNFDKASVGRYSDDKGNGYSVRCVRD